MMLNCLGKPLKWGSRYKHRELGHNILDMNCNFMQNLFLIWFLKLDYFADIVLDWLHPEQI